MWRERAGANVVCVDRFLLIATTVVAGLVVRAERKKAKRVAAAAGVAAPVMEGAVVPVAPGMVEAAV